MKNPVGDRHSRRKTSGGRFFIVMSWLLARLWWSIELSRLAVLRVRSRSVVVWAAEELTALPPSRWVLDKDRCYCLSVSEGTKQLHVTQTPPIGLN